MSVIVPEALTPPTTELGLIVMDDKEAGVTVSCAGLLTPSLVAVMVMGVFAPTGTVVIADVADDFPAAIVIDVGTFATEGLLLTNVIFAPAVSVMPVSEIVAVDPLPP